MSIDRHPPTPVGHRPSHRDCEAARAILAPWRWITAPRLSGLEHVPTDRPFLLAGNHTLMGVLDAPLMVLELERRLGVRVRALGDHLHFAIPGWRKLLEQFGVVDGTPDNVRMLMRAGESLLVFPGGGREVFKHKGEQYRLLWGQRCGFARLAIEFGYPIVPFASIGVDDMFDIVWDADDLLASPLGPLLRRLAPRPDLIPPVVRGIGLSVLPRPERVYFRFLSPIETAGVAGRTDDPVHCFAVRERVRHSVEAGIDALLTERDRDPNRALLPRLLHRAADARSATS